MFQFLSYFVAAGVNAANTDSAAIVDPNFSRRGGSTGVNHWIFTEPYDLLAAAHHAVSATSARFNVPSWNAIARQQIFPVMRSLTIPSNPQVRDMTIYPAPLPVNEEVAVEVSNNLGAATEQTFSHILIAPTGVPRTFPRGVARVMASFTAAPTAVINTWSADAAITFTDQLMGGTYAVIGCYCTVATLLAFRINFVRAPHFRGRKLLPGGLGIEAVGNAPLRFDPTWLGEWGRFNNFELPQIAVLASAGGALAVTGVMDLVYLGQNMDVQGAQA